MPEFHQYTHLKKIAGFQLVAFGGTVVNLGMLWFCRGFITLPLLFAGTCAIEAAIFHNYTWFYFRLWQGLIRHTFSDYVHRFIRYNIVTSSLDFIANPGILWSLTQYFHIHYLIADLIGMSGGPFAKYFVNEYFIFRKPKTIWI